MMTNQYVPLLEHRRDVKIDVIKIFRSLPPEAYLVDCLLVGSSNTIRVRWVTNRDEAEAEAEAEAEDPRTFELDIRPERRKTSLRALAAAVRLSI